MDAASLQINEDAPHTLGRLAIDVGGHGGLTLQVLRRFSVLGSWSFVLCSLFFVHAARLLGHINSSISLSKASRVGRMRSSGRYASGVPVKCISAGSVGRLSLI